MKRVQESLNKGNIGIALWDDAWLQDITAKSGKLAQHNEYQVHYWALVLRKIFEDGSILDVSIPTVIFNYEQKVSLASVDFYGKSFSEVSDELKEYNALFASELASKIPKEFYNLGFEPLCVSKMTLHRHP